MCEVCYSYTLSSGPSAPTVTATVVSSTAISVTWTEPDFPNGVLQSYNVTGIQHTHVCVYIVNLRNCKMISKFVNPIIILKQLMLKFAYLSPGCL